MTYSSGVRDRIESREESLSRFASRSRLSRGRQRAEELCPTRTAYQRDRDRILYSNAFRRLKHKTQVLIAPQGDHYVTRLTHTLEVAQVARSITRALNLNEDLAEAIALGHDLGHTPFGHVGEEVLDRAYAGGFRHNEQSLRVVDILEKDGQGLNLTWEVRDGILNHSKGKAEVLGSGWGQVGTLEGEVCKIADVVAYINHDTADAIRAGAISESDVPREVVDTLGTGTSRRIDTTIRDIIESSWAATGEIAILESPTIKMSPVVLEAVNIFRAFLFEKVYRPSAQMEDSLHAAQVVESLYHHYVDHPNELPGEYAARGDTPERNALDHVASMTDLYALRTAQKNSALHVALFNRPGDLRRP
jgi:dGTPase